MERDRKSSWVQWNASAQSWRARAMHFCSVQTPQISDPWREGEGGAGGSNCAASGFLSLWLLSSSQKATAAPNSVLFCLDLHGEIQVLRREQSSAFLPEAWTISGNLHSSHQPTTASVKGLAKTCTNLDTLHKIHVICSVYPQKSKCSAGNSPRRSNFPTLNFRRCGTQRKQDQLLETTHEWAKSAPSTPAVLSCFKSQFVLLPIDLTSKGAKEQIHGTFRWSEPTGLPGTRLPTGFESSNSSHRLEVPKSLFQLPVTCSEVPQQFPRAPGARCQTLQKFPLNFHSTQAPFFPLKQEISKKIGTNRAIPATHSFVLFQVLFFPKDFSGYVGHITVILSTDRAGLYSESARC